VLQSSAVHHKNHGWQIVYDWSQKAELTNRVDYRFRQTMPKVRTSTPMIHATARRAAISTPVAVTNNQQHCIHHHPTTAPFSLAAYSFSNDDCLEDDKGKSSQLDSQHKGSLKSPSLGNQLVGEETTRPVGDFSLLGVSVLSSLQCLDAAQLLKVSASSLLKICNTCHHWFSIGTTGEAVCHLSVDFYPLESINLNNSTRILIYVL